MTDAKWGQKLTRMNTAPIGDDQFTEEQNKSYIAILCGGAELRIRETPREGFRHLRAHRI